MEYDVSHFESLYNLGYLPIEIKALPEGTIIKEGIPLFTIHNTIPEFFWITNFLETFISTTIWKSVHSASISLGLKELLTTWALKTDPNNIGFVDFQAHDFSYRGMQSEESAIASGMGFLTSFKGTDTIPTLEGITYYYGDTEDVGYSVPACYDNQTEILTNKGWKLFNNLDKTELVAQYNLDKTIEFVKPLEYFKDRYKGKMIKFSKSKGYKYIDAIVTPNHKMVRLNESGALDLFEAGDFSYKNRKGYSHRNDLVISGNAVSKIRELTNLDRLKIAFQADGSFPSYKEDYNGLKGKGFPIRFSLKKDRKKERLEYLLKSENLEYTLTQYENGYYSFWINVPEKFVKDFSWVNLENLGYEECVDFINELQYWDGTLKNNCIIYSSINKNCIDTVQAICAISNYKTQYNEYIDPREDSKRKPLHTLSIQPNKTSVKGNNIVREEIDYDDYVYCVSVPSKMIITRRNNTVLVCGNTEHSVMCAHGKDGEIDTLKYLMNQYPKGILSVVSDTWDLWKLVTEYLATLKEEILARDGKLVCRPDSGDPVDIICGTLHYATGHRADITPEQKGVIELLWDIFGGTVNEQGYKVLDPHIGAIYGDSITIERAKEICEKLKNKGFASTNWVAGVGSYSLGYATRDQQGGAIKSTYVEINGKGREIFKDPITDDGTKKSAKGLLAVYKNEVNEYYLQDQVSWKEVNNCELKTIFKDGKLLNEVTLKEIREKINIYIK